MALNSGQPAGLDAFSARHRAGTTTGRAQATCAESPRVDLAARRSSGWKSVEER
jgi:hypothetical protein